MLVCRTKTKRWALLFVFAALSYTNTSQASDPNRPHEHQGLLSPITSAPTALPLTPSERDTLRAGGLVERHSTGEDGGAGVAVQYINASPAHVWDTILDYPRYKDRVKDVESCTVYKQIGNDIYVDMQIAVFAFDFGFYTKNTVRKAEGYMAWTLDYARKSDVNDMAGYWRVEVIQTTPPITKLEYSTQIKMRGVPDFIVRYLTRDALGEGTAWVKKYAEKAAQTQ